MRFVVLGAGSISRRHILNLRGLGHEIAAVYDPNSERLSNLQNLTSVECVSKSEDEALGQTADGVIICSPTVFHVQQARKAVERGLHVFVEKPLSNTLAGTNELVAEASAARRVVLVGCNLRFSPALQLVKQTIDEGRIGSPISARAHCGYYLPHWRPDTDYREGYGARQETGGGIILDAIHEFDYVRWLFGEAVELFCYAGKSSTLEIDVEDNADILLRFASGTTVNLHLDYLQRTYRRSCEVIGEDGVVIWDFITNQVTLFGKDDRHAEIFFPNINNELNHMFIAEMRHFVACIENKESPLLDAAGGRAVLQLALAAKESAAKREIVTIQK
jgi:predicted dehydrogenase